MKLNKILALIVVIAMMAAMMVGCGAKDKKDGFTFGATYWTMNNPYFIALEEGIRSTVEADGHELISYDPEDCRLVGEIVNVCPDESVPGENGKLDVKQLRPITYDPMNHHYLALGEKVGQAFHDGLALK
jgi:hypothetical protein